MRFPPKTFFSRCLRRFSTRGKRTISCALSECQRLEKIVQSAAGRGLQNAHQSHVPVSKEKQTKEWNRSKKMHVQGVNNRKQEIERERELKQRQQSPLALVFLLFPGFVAFAFNLVLRSSNKLRFDSHQCLEHRPRIRKRQSDA